jgi:hypothetical protein
LVSLCKKESCSAWSCISLPVPATKPLAWSRCHFQTLGDSKGINVVLSLNEVVCCFSRYTFLLYAQKLFTFWKITSKKITADRVALRTCPQLISRNGEDRSLENWGYVHNYTYIIMSYPIYTQCNSNLYYIYIFYYSIFYYIVLYCIILYIYYIYYNIIISLQYIILYCIILLYLYLLYMYYKTYLYNIYIYKYDIFTIYFTPTYISVCIQESGA